MDYCYHLSDSLPHGLDMESLSECHNLRSLLKCQFYCILLFWSISFELLESNSLSGKSIHHEKQHKEFWSSWNLHLHQCLASWSRWEGRTLGNPWIASCCECSKASVSPAPYHHLLMVFQAWKLIYFMEKTSWQKPARNETSNFCRRFGLFNLLLGHLKLHWWTNKNTYRKMITGSHFIP